MAAKETENVIFETVNHAGVITLNRPRYLNALSTAMTTSILSKLQEWETTQDLIIIKGAGDKAFCAGGDLKEASDCIKGPKLFSTEFKLVHAINNCKVPYVALIDGITMGGGMGVSIHGKYKVATEKTVVAMPENKIGLFPDVGGSYFLSQMPFNLGVYLGLTGQRLKASDVVTCGLATHYVLSKHLPELTSLLTKCSNDTEISSVLNKYSEPLEEFSLASHMKRINYCFSGDSVKEIVARLREVDDDWSRNVLKSLESMCPGSLKIALRAMQLGADMTLAQCLTMEYRIAQRATQGHDFREGVRALLIDKDNHPHWRPASLADVTDDYVAGYFKKLPHDQELYLSGPVEITVGTFRPERDADNARWCTITNLAKIQISNIRHQC